MSFATFIAAIVDSIFPPMCPFCGVMLGPCGDLCRDCAASLTRLGADSPPVDIGRLWFERCRSLFAYDGRVRDALHEYKYGNAMHLARFFAKELADVVESMDETDIIIPVPLGRKRQASRGFNQSALVARRVAKILGIKSGLNVLERLCDVPPQVGLSRKERIQNVKGIFEITGKGRKSIEEKRVLLIDDVMTTGATLNECSRMLVKAEAKRVSVLTIARTL